MTKRDLKQSLNVNEENNFLSYQDPYWRLVKIFCVYHKPFPVAVKLVNKFNIDISLKYHFTHRLLDRDTPEIYDIQTV